MKLINEFILLFFAFFISNYAYSNPTDCTKLILGKYCLGGSLNQLQRDLDKEKINYGTNPHNKNPVTKLFLYDVNDHEGYKAIINIEAFNDRIRTIDITYFKEKNLSEYDKKLGLMLLQLFKQYSFPSRSWEDGGIKNSTWNKAEFSVSFVEYKDMFSITYKYMKLHELGPL